MSSRMSTKSSPMFLNVKLVRDNNNFYYPALIRIIRGPYNSFIYSIQNNSEKILVLLIRYALIFTM